MMPRSGATKGGTNLCQSIGHHGLTGGSSPPAGTVVVEVSKAIGGGCLGAGYLLLGTGLNSDAPALWGRYMALSSGTPPESSRPLWNNTFRSPVGNGGGAGAKIWGKARSQG